MRLVIALLAALVALPALADARFPQTTRVAGSTLTLNGAGVRRMFFFKVYAVGLYVVRASREADELLAEPGPKRVAIRMLRDVGAERFTEALREGIRGNHDEAQLAALEPRIGELAALMKQIGEAKEGMNIALDWLPGTGTSIVIDGAARGKPIPGEDFYRALLRIWLGAHPVQEDLKQSLLGEGG